MFSLSQALWLFGSVLQQHLTPDWYSPVMQQDMEPLPKVQPDPTTGKQNTTSPSLKPSGVPNMTSSSHICGWQMLKEGGTRVAAAHCTHGQAGQGAHHSSTAVSAWVRGVQLSGWQQGSGGLQVFNLRSLLLKHHNSETKQAFTFTDQAQEQNNKITPSKPPKQHQS